MSIPKISGHEARELLALPDNAASWKIEQRNLAETVAWLYGGEPNEPYDEWRIEAGFGLRGQVHIADNQDGTVELVTGPYGVATYLKPDEAVEVARALLAAAEEARP